jgi:glycosyltransferase involved in cell wall biosynthesis
MYLTDKWHMLRYWWARRRLRQIFRDFAPDVIHSNDLPTHQIVSDAARGLGVPRICHHRFPFPGTAIDWMNKFGAQRHVFVSRALMDEMCAASSLLAHSPRAVLYDGLPLPPVPTDEQRHQTREDLNVPLDRAVFTIAGQVIERKGVADLIRAWAMLEPETRNRAELLVVGDDLAGNGKYRVEMEQLANGIGVMARFVGFQKNVPDWLTASDVAVVPSHVEPLGNATLEAMSYALPVIGSTAGGIPEMVVHEETGLLVPPRSPEQLAGAVRRLILDPGERARLGAGARQRCEELFSLTAHAQEALAQYRAVLPDRLRVEAGARDLTTI